MTFKTTGPLKKEKNKTHTHTCTETEMHYTYSLSVYVKGNEELCNYLLVQHLGWMVKQ